MSASAENRLLCCHACGLLARAPRVEDGIAAVACPRCVSRLHARKPDSRTRALALMLAAILLYVPANLLPIMTVYRLGSGVPSTILGGVHELVAGGLWSLALLVFFASVLVPVLKLVGLGYLLWSVRRGSRLRQHDRTRLYRLVEGIGRWSMVDMFVLSLLVSLVQIGNIATIETGAGASAFAAVVVLTMLAASSFDPRLIWDVGEEAKENEDE